MADRGSSGFGWFIALCIAIFVSVVLFGNVQDDPAMVEADAPERAATGGATTLEDIMRRQDGLRVNNDYRRPATGDPSVGAAMTDQLGTLGGASDPDLWRATRFGTATFTTQDRAPASNVLIQGTGMEWLQFRQGPLLKWGGISLLGMIGLLAIFYVTRGRIMIDGGPSGITIERFKPIERFGHWLLAGSFVLLGITGLMVLFGRKGLLPWMGHETYSALATWSKLIHNSVSWAFMLGLLMVFVMWVAHNLPNRYDLRWFREAGGLFSDAHPPAKKFNAGQKLIFWGTIVLGASISISGLALLFPFELHLFAKTFTMINTTGLPGLFGFDPLPEQLAPQTEMQLSQSWHAIVSFAMLAIIFAHIYLGSVGMQGAYDAMGTGQVDLRWAEQHHSIWVEEGQKDGEFPADPASAKATPAE